MTHKLLKVLLIAMIAMMPFTLRVNSLRAETGSTASPSAGATKIDRGKILLGPRDSASTPALTQDPAGWIMGKQQQFYRSMSLAIRDIGRGNSVAASLTLIGLSFGYGIFHAAGPGHGKAVVSAWLMGNDERLRRGAATGQQRHTRRPGAQPASRGRGGALSASRPAARTHRSAACSDPCARCRGASHR